jgi:DNA modification methylase
VNPALEHERAVVYLGDCVEVLAGLPEASVDAIVTDPPYGLEFMGKEWDSFKTQGHDHLRHVVRMDGAPPERGNPWASERNSYGSVKKNPRCRLCGRLRFSGSQCDCPEPVWDLSITESMHQFQAWCETWAVEALRVLKPGGHLLAFGGTRTYHRLTCAIEDAGFEIRDEIAWLYGSGFPKSLDVGKAIDKAAGAEREVIGLSPHSAHRASNLGYGSDLAEEGERVLTAPATTDAEKWNGWGTAMKPAHEPIVVARKPLSGSVAQNVLTHGTGALNIDATRVDTHSEGPGTTPPSSVNGQRGSMAGPMDRGEYDSTKGRWPPNVVLDESQAEALDRESGITRDSAHRRGDGIGSGYHGSDAPWVTERGFTDEGGASRFFPVFEGASDGSETSRTDLCRPDGGMAIVDSRLADEGLGSDLLGNRPPWKYEAKAPSEERPSYVREGERIAHATVKPLALMRWLVKLVTPPGGTVLDPFAGSGATIEAAMLEDFRAIGIEREADYLPLIQQRLDRVPLTLFGFGIGA